MSEDPSQPASQQRRVPQRPTPEEIKALEELAERKRRALLESNKMADLLAQSQKSPASDSRIHRSN
jgi:hypothetical protein